MYNLCGQGVQFVRFECSINAVALFNSERSGCLMWAGYLQPEKFDKIIVHKTRDSSRILVIIAAMG